MRPSCKRLEARLHRCGTAGRLPAVLPGRAAMRIVPHVQLRKSAYKAWIVSAEGFVEGVRARNEPFNRANSASETLLSPAKSPMAKHTSRSLICNSESSMLSYIDACPAGSERHWTQPARSCNVPDAGEQSGGTGPADFCRKPIALASPLARHPGAEFLGTDTDARSTDDGTERPRLNDSSRFAPMRVADLLVGLRCRHRSPRGRARPRQPRPQFSCILPSRGIGHVVASACDRPFGRG